MTEGVKRRGSGLWLAVAVVAVVGVPLVAFGFQTGSCVDYVAESGAESFCATGPAVGLAGAWALSVAAVLFAAYAVRRGLSARRQL